jgi:hypothetical protein
LLEMWTGSCGDRLVEYQDKYKTKNGPTKNDLMQAEQKAKLAAEFPPGSIILSRDKKTRYRVQPDGAWKKISDQEAGEFEEVAAKDAAFPMPKTNTATMDENGKITRDE